MAEIQCQKKHCRSWAVWIVTSPELLKGKPDECDVLQRPIGFCSTTHLAEFFVNEYNEWAMDESRKFKRMKKVRGRGGEG